MRTIKNARKKHLFLLTIGLLLAALMGIASALNLFVPGLHASAAGTDFSIKAPTTAPDKMTAGGTRTPNGATEESFDNWTERANDWNIPNTIDNDTTNITKDLQGHCFITTDLMSVTPANMRESTAMNATFNSSLAQMQNTASGNLGVDGKLGGSFAAVFKRPESGVNANNTKWQAIYWSDVSISGDVRRAQYGSITAAMTLTSINAGNDKNIYMTYFIAAYKGNTQGGYINGSPTGNGLEEIAQADLYLLYVGDGTNHECGKTGTGVPFTPIPLTLKADFSEATVIRVGMYMYGTDIGSSCWIHAPVITQFQVDYKGFELEKPTSADNVTGYSHGTSAIEEDATAKTADDWDNYVPNWRPANRIGSSGASSAGDVANDGTGAAYQGFVLNGLLQTDASDLRSTYGMNDTFNEATSRTANTQLKNLSELGQNAEDENNYAKRFSRDSDNQPSVTQYQTIIWSDIKVAYSDKGIVRTIWADLSIAASQVSANRYGYYTFFMIGYSGGTPGYINGTSNNTGGELGDVVFSSYQYQRYGQSGGGEYATRVYNGVKTAYYPHEAHVSYTGDLSGVAFVRIGIYVNHFGAGWVHAPFIHDYGYETETMKDRDISSAEDFVQFANDIERYMTEGTTVRLTQDIDLSGKTTVQAAKLIDEEILDIDAYVYGKGSYPKAWQGTFEGGGHVITGIEQGGTNDTGIWITGLFGMIGLHGSVCNLALGAGTMRPLFNTGSGHGTFAGWCYGAVENCVNFGTTVDASGATGGIVGFLGQPGHVSKCVNFADLTNCANGAVARGTINQLPGGSDPQGNYVGGIVGACASRDVTYEGTLIPALDKVANYGTLATVDVNAYVGGIAGYLGAGATTTGRYLYNFGALTGETTTRQGGVLGQAGSNATLSYAWYVQATGATTLVAANGGSASTSNCLEAAIDPASHTEIPTDDQYATDPDIHNGLPHLTALHTLLTFDRSVPLYTTDVAAKVRNGTPDGTKYRIEGAAYNGQDQRAAIIKALFTDGKNRVALHWNYESAGARYLQKAAVPAYADGTGYAQPLTITDVTPGTSATGNLYGQSIVDAGTYRLTFCLKFCGETLIEITEDDATEYVLKKVNLGNPQVQVDGSVLTHDTRVTYNGEERRVGHTEGALPDGYRYLVTYESDQYGTAIPRHVGDYAITLKLQRNEALAGDAEHWVDVTVGSDSRNFEGTLPGTLTLHVDPMQLTATWDGGGSEMVVTYNGTEQKPAYTLTGTIYKDEVTVGFDAPATDFIHVLEGDTATLALALTWNGDAETYHDYTFTAPAALSYRILPKDVTLVWAQTPVSGTITAGYNGENQLPGVLVQGTGENALDYGWRVTGDEGLIALQFYLESGGGTTPFSGQTDVTASPLHLFLRASASGTALRDYRVTMPRTMEGMNDGEVFFSITRRNIQLTFGAGSETTLSKEYNGAVQVPTFDTWAGGALIPGDIHVEGLEREAWLQAITLQLTMQDGSVPTMRDYSPTGYVLQVVVLLGGEADDNYTVTVNGRAGGMLAYQITQRDISGYVTVAEDDFVFNGVAVAPTVVFADGALVGEDLTNAAAVKAALQTRLNCTYTLDGASATPLNVGSYAMTYAMGPTNGSVADNYACNGTHAFTISPMPADRYSVAVSAPMQNWVALEMKGEGENRYYRFGYGSGTTFTFKITLQFIHGAYGGDVTSLLGLTLNALGVDVTNGLGRTAGNVQSSMSPTGFQADEGAGASLTFTVTVSGWNEGDLMTLTYAGVAGGNIANPTDYAGVDNATMRVRAKAASINHTSNVSATWGATNTPIEEHGDRYVYEPIAGLDPDGWVAEIDDEGVIKEALATAGQVNLFLAGAGTTKVTLRKPEDDWHMPGTITLTVRIGKASLSVQVLSSTVVYGNHPTGEAFRVSGYVYDETDADVFGAALAAKIRVGEELWAYNWSAGDPYLPYFAAEGGGNGAYDVEIYAGETAVQGMDLNNYTLAYAGGSVTVQRRTLTVRATLAGAGDSGERITYVYGRAYHASDVDILYDGFAEGEDAALVFGANLPTATLRMQQTTGSTTGFVDVPEGSLPDCRPQGYTILPTVAPGVANNYAIVTAAATLTVTPAAIGTAGGSAGSEPLVGLDVDALKALACASVIFDGDKASFDFAPTREEIAGALRYASIDGLAKLQEGWTFRIDSYERVRGTASETPGEHGRVGIYNVRVTITPNPNGTENYSYGSVELEQVFKVDKAAPQLRQGNEWSLNADRFTYNGGAQWMDFLYFGSTGLSGTVTATFIGEDGTEYATTGSAVTNAGRYTIRITYEPDGYFAGYGEDDDAYWLDNYAYAELEIEDVYVLVDKAQFRVTLPEPTSLPYDAHPHAVTASVTGVGADGIVDSGVDVTVLYSSTGGSSWDAAAPVHAGDWWVQVTVAIRSDAENAKLGNYTDTVVEWRDHIRIGKATISGVEFTYPDGKMTLPYSGNDQILDDILKYVKVWGVQTGTDSEGNEVYESIPTEDVSVQYRKVGTSATLTSLRGVGNYVLVIRYVGSADSDYEGQSREFVVGEGEGVLEITPMNLVPSYNHTPQTYTYSGDSFTLTVTVNGVENERPSGTLTVTYERKGSDGAYETLGVGELPSNAGTYRAVIVYNRTGVDDNYIMKAEDGGDTLYTEDLITITPADVGMRLTKQSYEYDGTGKGVLDPLTLLQSTSDPRLTLSGAQYDRWNWTSEQLADLVSALAITVEFKDAADGVEIGGVKLPKNRKTYDVKVVFDPSRYEGTDPMIGEVLQNYARTERRFADAIEITAATPTIRLVDQEGNVIAQRVKDGTVTQNAVTVIYDAIGHGSGVWSDAGTVFEVQVITKDDAGNDKVYAVGGMQVVVQYFDAVASRWVNTRPVNVGEYGVRVMFTDNMINNQPETFLPCTARFDNLIHIQPRTLVVVPTTPDETALLNAKVYDGMPIEGIAYTLLGPGGVPGLVGSDVLEGRLFADGVNVGDHIIRLGNPDEGGLRASDNYDLQLAEGDSYYRILPRLVDVVFQDMSSVYDGSAKSASYRLLNVLEGEDALAQLRYDEGADRINAGTFGVSVQLSNPNYQVNEGTAYGTYTILNAELPEIVFQSQVVAYDGLAHALVIDPAQVPEGASVHYLGANTYREIADYTVTAEVSKANYNTRRVSATLSIVRGNLQVEVSVPAATYRYGDPMPQLICDNQMGYVTFDAGQSLSPGQLYYNWTFVPYDTTHYDVVQGRVYIAVQKARTNLSVRGSLSQVENESYALSPVLPEGVEAGDVTITYYSLSGEKLEGVPTAPGRYSVVVTYAGNTNYDEATFITELVIKEKSHLTLYLLIAAGVLVILAIASGIFFASRKMR